LKLHEQILKDPFLTQKYKESLQARREVAA
jgi:hypothetical protein